MPSNLLKVPLIDEAMGLIASGAVGRMDVSSIYPKLTLPSITVNSSLARGCTCGKKTPQGPSEATEELIPESMRMGMLST